MSENFRSFEFWEIPANATARESPPTTISARHKADFRAMLHAAGQVGSSGDADLFVYLGAVKSIVLVPSQEPWMDSPGRSARKIMRRDPLGIACRRMALAEMRLSQSPNETTFSDAATMPGRDDVVRASTSNEKPLEQGVAVSPEIAAATTSFSRSNERANGLYLIVDVGAMTMDVWAFYSGRKQGGDACSVFAADVRPLGVEARHWFLQNGRGDDAFRTRIGRCLHEVVIKTKREYWKAPEFRRGNDLPFFFFGGGSNGHVREEQLNEIGAWMNEYYAHDGLRRPEISVPTAIDMDGIDLSVA